MGKKVDLPYLAGHTKGLNDPGPVVPLQTDRNQDQRAHLGKYDPSRTTVQIRTEIMCLAKIPFVSEKELKRPRGFARPKNINDILNLRPFFKKLYDRPRWPYEKTS